MMPHKRDILEMLEEAAKFNSVFTITTKYGNAIILSESDYRNMLETVGVDYYEWMKEKERSDEQ